MEYTLLQVIAGKVGLQAGELARERIRSLFLTAGAPGPQALDESSRSEMEALTGYDLSGALIHNSFRAGSLAHSMDAEAFTVGRHIFSPPGKIDTAFSSGRALLAHELTHVIQQTAPPRTLTPMQAEAGMDTTAGAGRATLPLVQLARVTAGTAQDNSTQRSLEAEAEQHENEARQPERERTQQSELDKDMLADMVYRLMQHDLLVHQDRRR